MWRNVHRPFSLDDGTNTIIIRYTCRNGHDSPVYEFRTVAGEVAIPLGKRGHGGVYEIERDGKKVQTVPQLSHTALVMYQKENHAANLERIKRELTEKYGPEIAEKWDTLTKGEKISEAFNRRTPEQRAEVGKKISQALNKPEVKNVLSKARKANWAERRFRALSL